MYRAWALGMLMLCAAVPAHASTAFLGLRTLGVDDRESQALEAGLSRRLQQVLWRRDVSLTERCKGDARCYCAATREHKLSRVIFGNVGRIEALYTFELVVVDTQNCSIEDSVFVTERHDPQSAAARIGELGARLLRPREQVTKTVAKAERVVDQVPGLVTVVTDTQMQQLGLTRLTELFRVVPSFEVVDTNWGDVVLHHGLTGTVLYMLDGVPLSNPKFNISTLGRDFQLSLNHVERVELVNGPGSVLWGQNAYLGIVNLTTRSPRSDRERLRLHLRLGTLNTQEVSASIEANRRWFSYYVGTTWSRSEGPSTRVENSLYAELGDGISKPVWGNGGTTDSKADTFFNVVARLRLAGRLDLLLHYITYTSYFEISPFGSLLPADDRGRWDGTHILYSAAWEDGLPRGFRYRLSASRYEYHSFENFVVHPRRAETLPFGFSSLQGNQNAPETNHLVEARLYHTYEGRRLTNRALLGASFLHQQMPEQYATLTTGRQPGKEALDIDAHYFVTVSTYLQDDLSLLGGRLLVSGGLRYDWHDPFQSALSSQWALIAGVERLYGKLVYAEGFRAPSMNNLYSTAGTKGNPKLRPERSRALSLELSGKPAAWLTLRLGGTLTWLTDQIQLETITDEELKRQGFAVAPVNRARTTIAALHGEVRLSWPWMSAFAHYTFKHLEENAPADPACRGLFERVGSCVALARHTASAGLSLRPINDLAFFSTLSVVGPRTMLARSPESDLVEVTTAAYALFDVGLTLSNVLGMFDVTVKASNPARVSYSSPYQLAGRPSPLLEPRRPTELMLTLAWAGGLPWPSAAAPASVSRK